MMMLQTDAFVETLISIWNAPLLTVGSTDITVGSITILVVSLSLVVLVLSVIRRLFLRLMVKRLGVGAGPLYSVSLIIQYAIAFLAFLVIFQSVGFDLSSLTVILGAFGIGVGFGLQNIINNFVSGIIILIERPIKVGDRVEVSGVEGDVTSIAMRASTVVTNEGVAVVVPNSEFINHQVVNRSHQAQDTRYRLPVGVAYESDPEVVKETLLRVAREHPGVLQDPPPIVIFEKFGESSLDFFLWVWTRSYYNKPYLFRSEMNFAIHAALKEAGITLPFPQRDLHIKSDERQQPRS